MSDTEAAPTVSAEAKAQAAEAKAAGGAAYKKRDFDAAIEKYTEAAELDPTDMTFHLNMAAVHLEKGSFDACVASCNKAVEVGQDNRADYTLIAKAYARMAKAYLRMDNLEQAAHWADKALTNHRSADNLKLKKEIDAKLKIKREQEYIDPEKAQEAKKRGNDHFRAGKYPEAIKEYTEAIKRNPEDAKTYSNRAAAYTKVTAFDLAVKDCDECITRDPTFIKGYLRKGGALLAMKKTTEAEKVYAKALEIDATNAEAKDGVRKCQMQSAGYGMSQQERAEQAMNDPEVQEIMGDPIMQQILQQMQQDPAAVQEHLKNPDIRAKIMKLAQSGILSFGGQ